MQNSPAGQERPPPHEADLTTECTVHIYEADLTVAGSYDAPMAGCSCVVHVGTPMGYNGDNNPREVFDGAVEGTMNIIDTIKRVGSVRRLIYTSSFAAVSCRMPRAHARAGNPHPAT